jgi:NAD(P)H-hydrate epimerase
MIAQVKWDDLPQLSTADMQRVFMLATGKFGMDARVLVEHAGRDAAELLGMLAPEGQILVVAGRGHNGACGLAAARQLAVRGRSVWVVPTHEAENYSGTPREQLEMLKHYKNVRIRSSLPKMKFTGAIDAAIGTMLEGPPRGRTLDVITVLNNMNGCCVMALDAPTGLIADDGTIPGDVVKASATLALALPKRGVRPGGDVGSLYVADLGIPPALYEDMGMNAVNLPAWITEVTA